MIWIVFRRWLRAFLWPAATQLLDWPLDWDLTCYSESQVESYSSFLLARRAGVRDEDGRNGPTCREWQTGD
jgi:hypothetical protein